MRRWARGRMALLVDPLSSTTTRAQAQQKVRCNAALLTLQCCEQGTLPGTSGDGTAQTLLESLLCILFLF